MCTLVQLDTDNFVQIPVYGPLRTQENINSRQKKPSLWLGPRYSSSWLQRVRKYIGAKSIKAVLILKNQMFCFSFMISSFQSFKEKQIKKKIPNKKPTKKLAGGKEKPFTCVINLKSNTFAIFYV